MSDVSWLLFSILGSAIYGINNFFDKYFLQSKLKDYRALVIYTSIISFLFGSFYWALTGFPIVIFNDAFFIILTGIFTIWGLALYLRALSSEETSMVIVFMQMTPVITLLISTLFLKENISNYQIIGFILILVAVIGISLRRNNSKLKFSIAFLYILMADIFWAISNVLFKFVVSTTSFSQLIAYESFGIAIGGLILYLLFQNIRNAFFDAQKSLKKNTIALIFINESIFILAKFVSFFAISLGPVSLVSITGSTQIFFGIFYGWVLTNINNAIYQENISAYAMIKKIVVTIIVFIGIWLMQY